MYIVIEDVYGDILHEVNINDNTPLDQRIKVAVEQLVKEDKSLAYADLSYCNLQRVDLRRANLNQANLKGADLTDANLDNSYLGKANLTGVCLIAALMKNTLLNAAIIEQDIILVAKDNYFIIDDVEIFNTNKGPYFRYTEFFGNAEKFEMFINRTFEYNNIVKYYLNILKLAKYAFSDR